MNRKVILLNVLLVSGVIWLGYVLRAKWKEDEAHRAEVVKQAVHAPPVSPPPAAAPVPRPSAAEYLDVAQRTLFSKDRNPNVEVPVPAPPPPPPPVPPLPVYRGQMSIGEPVIFLNIAPGDEKSYRKGDTVGKFKLIAFDRDNITLEWDGKNLEHKLTDLTSKEPQPVQQQTVAAAPPPAPSAVTSLGGGGNQVSTIDDNPTLGVDMGGQRACVASDHSPAGTILNGYKKVITQTLMGQSCHWEPLNR